MIPLIEREVIDRRGWIERDDFMAQLTLAQSVPGPIALNTAVFTGYKVGGVAGAVAAAMGVIVPSFAIILLIALYFAQFKDNRYVAAAFKGMRPAVVALMAAPMLSFLRGMRWWKIAVAAAVALLIWQLGISPVWFIVVGSVAGVVNCLYEKRRAQ